ncbi:MAG: hypothetical protein ABIG46_08905 [Candidatus Omnitrophota bacterium]|nr:hypothetical protein [Candidatus Omnitrophota bacterium]
MPLNKKKKAKKAATKKVVKKKVVKIRLVKKVAKKVVRKKPQAGKKSIKPKKKSSAKRVSAKKGLPKGIAASDIIGEVTHYFPHVQAGVVKLKAPLVLGDTIRIKGHTTDFNQTINSMQIDRSPIQQAKKGDEIGILVKSRVRRRDLVVKA